MMASPRKSRRLSGEQPEIVRTKFRCICLVEGEACDLRAMQLPCCRQYCHKKCLEEWRGRGHDSCPFCRQSSYPSEQHSVDRIPPVPGHLSRDQVIQRLEQLLSDVHLREEIERVSNLSFFFLF